MAYKIEKDTAVVYKVRSIEGFGWAIATIREWKGGGSIDIQSDYGPFSCSWTAIGDRTLREFLCSLHFGYFMNKAASNHGRVIDLELTRKEWVRQLLAMRRVEGITKSQARDAYDTLDIDGLWGPASKQEFIEAFGSSSVWYQVMDYPEFFEGDCPQCRGLWDGPWQALCRLWREEIAEKSESVKIRY